MVINTKQLKNVINNLPDPANYNRDVYIACVLKVDDRHILTKGKAALLNPYYRPEMVTIKFVLDEARENWTIDL